MVRGLSTTNLIYVVKKTFESGEIFLSPGGPITAAPILFSTHNKKMPKILIERNN